MIQPRNNIERFVRFNRAPVIPNWTTGTTTISASDTEPTSDSIDSGGARAIGRIGEGGVSIDDEGNLHDQDNSMNEMIQARIDREQRRENLTQEEYDELLRQANEPANQIRQQDIADEVVPSFSNTFTEMMESYNIRRKKRKKYTKKELNNICRKRIKKSELT